MFLRLTGKRDRLIGCVEKESILDKDISTCLPVSLNVVGRSGGSVGGIVICRQVSIYPPTE